MDVLAIQQARASLGYKSRRASAALNSPETTQAAAALDYTIRTVMRLPSTTTRWRLKIANRNPRLNTALTTPFSGTGLWVGTPVEAGSGNHRWTGDYTGTPTQALSSFTVPVDGTAYTSPWVTSAALQFPARTQVLLSIGLTSTNSGTGYATASSSQWARVTTTGSSHAADVAITGLGGFAGPNGTNNPLDVIVEYEYVGTKPIGLFVGDSITYGTGDGDWGGAQPGATHYEGFPGIAGSMGGFHVINMGIGSAKLDDAILANYYFSRFDLATTVPDFAVIALGTNNVGSAATSSMTLLGSNAIAALRSLGVQRIYLSTLLPRTDLAALQGTLQAASIAGATSVSSSISIASGTAITIGYGRKQDRVTTNGAPTGTGPFTIPTPALSFAHNSGDQIISGTEMNRQQYNDFMRLLPYGTVGCLDFDALMAVAPGSATPDPRVISNDGVHPLRGGYARMAALAALLGGPSV